MTIRPVNGTSDLNKARTYYNEYVKLLKKREKDEIHDQGLERVLDCSDLKKREETYLKRLDRIEEDIKSGRAKRQEEDYDLRRIEES